MSMSKYEEAIENIKKMLEYNKNQLKLCEEFEGYPINEEIDLINKNIKTYETILNIIKMQDKKIRELQSILNPMYMQ